eukprot:18313-Heterococcus_DN1.PRE.3
MPTFDTRRVIGQPHCGYCNPYTLLIDQLTTAQHDPRNGASQKTAKILIEHTLSSDCPPLLLRLTSTETQHQVQSALLLDVVVAQSAAILELLASEDETLLIRGDALLVLDLLLDVVN